MKGHKEAFPEEAQISPTLLHMFYKLIFCGKIKHIVVTKEEQSSFENLTLDTSSPAVLAANGKQSLEIGAALWSQWLRSGRALRCTPAQVRAVGNGTKVSRRFSPGLCRSRLNVQGKQLDFVGSYTNPIHYHWNNKDWGLSTSEKSSLWYFQDWHPELT